MKILSSLHIQEEEEAGALICLLQSILKIGKSEFTQIYCLVCYIQNLFYSEIRFPTLTEYWTLQTTPSNANNEVTLLIEGPIGYSHTTNMMDSFKWKATIGNKPTLGVDGRAVFRMKSFMQD